MKINNEPIGRSEFIANLIKKNDYKRIAEIGVLKGENAKGILDRVRAVKKIFKEFNLQLESPETYYIWWKQL